MSWLMSTRSEGLSGNLTVPGDKSISHRSVILGSIAEGASHISGILEGDDVVATISAFRKLGVQITGPSEGELVINGVGKNGLSVPPTR